MKKLYFFLFCLCSWAMAYGQGSISGTVVDAATNEALIGASIIVTGTTNGTVTDLDGNFTINNVEAGDQTIEISYVGYTTMSMDVSVSGATNVGQVGISTSAVGLQEIMVVADVAIDRKTPVAVSTITSEHIETKIGNNELPEMLNHTPSVYATKSGGGYGDARINIRGFNQRNVAVMINGIPVNDMENGWVFWSNWAGLSDVTRTMQVQRGLGASKLAISSVGGTMNIITKTTDQKKGGSVQTTIGNDGFLKVGATLSTGRLANGMAITFSGSRTQGDGYIDGTYIDAWSYFLAVSKDFGTKHQLSFTAIGAPQKHGQRTFREDLSAYVDSDGTIGAAFREMIADSKAGDWINTVSSGGIDVAPKNSLKYNGDTGISGGDFYNMRENFYHKPQMALNHYWNISDKMFLGTSAYLSFGRGGGTGDRGRINGRGPWGYRDANGHQRIDDIIAWNSGNSVDGFPEGGKFQTSEGYVSGERDGIIKRASMNSHNWMGLLSKLDIELSHNLSLSTGVDVRSYKGIHFRKVVDLLGTDKWLEPRDVNAQSVTLDINGDGDTFDRETGKFVNTDGKLFGNPGQEGKINYDNDGVVSWMGVFAELEYSPGELTTFISGSLSNTSYKRIDRFNYLDSDPLQEVDGFSFGGYNFKAGANINMNKYMNVYFNTGIYSKAPIFDAVFPFFNNVNTNPDANNEKIFGLEAGYGLRFDDIRVNVNVYRTEWNNKTLFTSVQLDDETGFANIEGLNALHQGLEIEWAYGVFEGFELIGSASFNNWEWKNNVNAKIADDDNIIIAEVDVFAKDIKVGDAPQTQAFFGAEYTRSLGGATFGLDAGYRYVSNLYADFDPADRDDPSFAHVQPLRLPDYGLLDGGAWVKFNVAGYDARLRVNLNNILDNFYVAEADDAPTLDEAPGYFGYGRTWNTSLKVWF